MGVHKKCIGITELLVTDSNYFCPGCNGESWPIDDQIVTEVDVDDTVHDVEDTFFYLQNMLCFKGDCVGAMAVRQCGLRKVQETLVWSNYHTPLT